MSRLGKQPQPAPAGVDLDGSVTTQKITIRPKKDASQNRPVICRISQKIMK
jgi:hypothetical protein